MVDLAISNSLVAFLVRVYCDKFQPATRGSYTY